MFASGSVRKTGNIMTDFTYSFEFFPPKTEKAGLRLDKALDALEGLNPEYVSITYGAGGTTRERTFKTVENIHKKRSVNPATHLTCVNASREEIDQIVQEYLDMGINHFVALRGDPPGAMDGVYTPREDGYAYASDLVAGIRALSSRAKISVSAYPERHPESGNWRAELDNLKRKVDAGADNAITQFFFEADTFLTFQDRAATAGINLPIIPGIMLQPNFKGLCNMSSMCGVDVPQSWHDAYEKAGEDKAAIEALTVELATKLVGDLQAGGVEHFHFYTLNTAPITTKVIKALQAARADQSKSLAYL